MKYQKLTPNEITLVFIACLLVLSTDGFAFPESGKKCPIPFCRDPCEVAACEINCVSVPGEKCDSCPVARCIIPDEEPKGWKPEKKSKGWKIGNPHWRKINFECSDVEGIKKYYPKERDE
ncbi:hypothetical protein G9A89_008567 [Geosiphon pyriformis]|nr:hypothetical protein G9A89_008567 [Geosiphon pyriformis]